MDNLILASLSFKQGTKQFQYLSIPTLEDILLKWKIIKMTQAISVFKYSNNAGK
jgi:hypothetical protein